MYSLIIHGGILVDGSGGPGFRADIGVTRDTIAAIDDLRGQRAECEIDATGKIVTPGFIDIHNHSDLQLLVDGRAESHIRQGVTTAAIGNCGMSLAPLTDQGAAAVVMSDMYPGVNCDWRDYAGYLNRLEQVGVSINVVPLVGQGTIREFVMGFDDRPATDIELQQMKGLVDGAMSDGCFGMSTGLIYTPSCYANTDEIVALTRVVAEHGGLYASHIRGENDTLLAAISEAIEIGRESGVPVQVSHLKAMGSHMWGASVEALRLIDAARADGIEVNFDQYPYEASATGLSAVFPPWTQTGGREQFLARLADREDRARMKHDIENGLPGWTSLLKGVGWDKMLITDCPTCHAYEGQAIAALAQRRGHAEFDTACELLMDANGHVDMVYFTISDDDLERIMRHPAGMVGSDSSALAVDGPLAMGKPHPRTFGTFVRVLGHYVRERKVISLSEAVRRMTSAPAQKLRLSDRGLLRQGMKADIVVFNPDTVADCATYTQPLAYPVGVDAVLVNGQVAIDGSGHTGLRAGAVLRHGSQRP